MEAGKEGEGVGKDETAGNMSASWKEKIAKEWRRIRDHAETYPYVWGSYIVVYGSFGVYLTYRWRKLRRTEARVRVLQERLRKLVEEDEAAAAGSESVAGDKPPKSVLMPMKADDKLH